MLSRSGSGTLSKPAPPCRLWLLEMKRRGLLGGTGTGGCCATTHSQGGGLIVIALLALIGFRRFPAKAYESKEF